MEDPEKMEKCACCEAEFSWKSHWHQLKGLLFCGLICVNIYTFWQLMAVSTRPPVKELYRRFMGIKEDA